MSIELRIEADVSSVAQGAENLRQVFTKVQQDFAALSQKTSQASAQIAQSAVAFNTVREMMETIQQATKATARATQVMAQTMLESSRTAATATQDLAQKTQQSSASMSRAYGAVHSSVTQLLGVLAALGVAVSVGGLIRGAIQTASAFEDLDVQLRFLLGSMEKFQQARQFILRFAAETPLTIQEVTRSFAQLTRAGLDAQKLLPAFVDVASLQNFPAEALRGIVLAITQIADRGKLAGQELIQLSQVGVPIGRVRDELQKMGITIKGDIGDASVTAKQGIQAIVNVIDKDFRGAVQAMLGNWSVITSNLIDVWQRFESTVVRGPLFDFLKAVTDLLREQMQTAVEQDTAAFQAFGGQAVGALKDVALSIAKIIDNASLLGTTFQSLGVPGFLQQAAEGSQRWNEALRTTIEGLQAVGRGELSLTEFLFTRIPQLQERLKQLKEQGGVAGAVEGSKTAEQATMQFFDTVEARTRALNKQTEDALAKAKGVQPREQKPDDTPQLKAVAARLKGEEATLQASLKRQEALTAASFDVRRQLLDEEIAQRLEVEPAAVEQLGQERKLREAALGREEAAALETLRLDSTKRILESTLAQLSAETAAHAGQIPELAKIEAERVAAKAKYEQSIEEIAAHRTDTETKLTKQALDDQIKAAQDTAKLLQQITDQIEKRDEQTMENRRREVERELDQQQRLYEQFSDRVTSRVGDVFAGLLEGTLSLVDTFKKVFLNTIAQIAAELVTRPIIVPIVASVLGTVTGALSPALGAAVLRAVGLGGAGGGGAETGGAEAGGLGGVAQTGLAGLGLAGLFPSGTIGNVLAQPIGTFLPPDLSNVLPFGLQNAQLGTTLVTGIAGLTGGIMGLIGAVNANTTEGRIFKGLGAGLGFAGAIPTPLSPFLLAGSALFQLLGGLFSPAGPRFNLAAPTGVSIGGGAGGLSLIGSAITDETRAQRVPSGQDVGQVQQALQSSITTALLGMIDLINQTVLNPEALVGPAQEDLTEALNTTLRVNSASAKNFQKDIAAQVQELPIEVSSGLLRPLGLAFEQLIGSPIATQAARLPQAAAAMSSVLDQFNKGVEELQKTGQSDVLNALSRIRGRIEAFRAQISRVLIIDLDQVIAQTQATSQMAFAPTLAKLVPAARVQEATLAMFQQAIEALSKVPGFDQALFTQRLATLRGAVVDLVLGDIRRFIDIAKGSTTQFAPTVQTLAGLPSDVTGLDPRIAALATVAQAFVPVVNEVQQGITDLTAAITPLPDQVAEAGATVADLQQQIADAGTDYQVLLPLVDQYTKALSRETQLRIQQVQEQQKQIQSLQQLVTGYTSVTNRIRQLIQSTQAPALTRQQLESQISQLEALLPTQTGDEQLKTLTDLVDLNQQLLELGKSSNLLDIQQEAVTNLTALQTLATEQQNVAQQQLDQLNAQTDLETQIKNIQQESLDELRAILAQLQSAFPTPGQQIGGLAAARQQGGLVRVMAEPRELVFPGPLTPIAVEHLAAVNRMFPRVGEPKYAELLMPKASKHVAAVQRLPKAVPVPGIGEGDTIPLTLPERSFVLNRRAAGVITQLSARPDRSLLSVATGQPNMSALAVVSGQVQEPLVRTGAAATNPVASRRRDPEAILAQVPDPRVRAMVTQLSRTVPDSRRPSLITALLTPGAPASQLLLSPRQQESIRQATSGRPRGGQRLESSHHAAFEGPVVRAMEGSLGPTQRQYSMTVMQPLHGPGAPLSAHMSQRGESLWLPPLTPHALRGLHLMNEAVPRFGGVVPGYASGDTVPMALPPGSFVLNRHTSRALQGGGEPWPDVPMRALGQSTSGPGHYQGGGTVSGGQSKTEVNIHGGIHVSLPNAHLGSDGERKQVARELARDIKRELEELYARQARSPHRDQRLYP